MESVKSKLIDERKSELEEWIESEGNPYHSRFTPDHSTQEIKNKYANLKAGERVNVQVCMGGRVVARRGHGKAIFIDMRDGLGKIQAYARQDVLREKYPLFQKLDLGDIIGVRGGVFKTRTGELTLDILEFTLLAKSLRPLPEKWHGLQDIELRYRKRYLDLLANPEVKSIFIQRGAIIKSIRDFLNERGYLEVETPMMQPIPGGANARPFRTHHYALDRDFYLRIAPELYLKKLVVGGLEKVYELNKNFRNEGMDRFHNPEFTMLEVYSAYSDYEGVMSLCEELICEVAKRANDTLKISYQGSEINLSPPWRRLTFKKALGQIGGLKVNCKDENNPGELASKAGSGVKGLSRAQILEHLLDKQVVPRLIQPTFILDYPEETSPLARRKGDDSSLIERFEVFIGGEEIGNAYSELNNPIEQRERLLRAKREYGSLDEDFLEAIEHGMPPTGGLGIGIDRLVMLLTDSPSIRDVILFPQMRPK